jgi:predicted alpha/beta superfamily hydrolase
MMASRSAAMVGRCAALAALLLAVCSPARGDDREDVAFAISHTTVLGQSVYVLGDLPELGGGNPALAVKLQPGSYPLWQAPIALPKGTSFTYQYTWRNDAVGQWSNPANHNPIGSPIAASTGPSNHRPARKGMYYHSGWSPPVLNWRTNATDAFTTTTMTDFGPGRSVGERRWRAIGVGVGGREIEFFFTNGGGAGRDPVSGTYKTRLDGFLVQSGHVFDYTPSPTVSAPRRDYNPASPPGINAASLGGELRRYRVLLPRGYDQHTDRHYPVLYMHDGQNVFESGPFGTWNAHIAAESLTRGGRMRETIIVGIDNTSNRFDNYIPPDDGGEADDYAAFIVNELKPLIDASYRTLPGREHTGTIGSSLGGLVSLYLGWDHNGVFSRVGPMSGSWQFGNFPTRVAAGPHRDLRIYLDSGDSGASNDNAWGAMNVRDRLLQDGWVLGRDLRHVVGYGHQHNEAAWAARVGFAFEFLFPATEADNPLRAEIFTGDFDGDGDMDLDDYHLLFLCLGGPDAAPDAACPADVEPDLDGDGDADLVDVGIFLYHFSG